MICTMACAMDAMKTAYNVQKLHFHFHINLVVINARQDIIRSLAIHNLLIYVIDHEVEIFKNFIFT